MNNERPQTLTSAQVNAEHRPFWEPLFKELNIKNPKWNSKLCYVSNEFSNDGSKEMAVSFWEHELEKDNDLYCELYNWSSAYYHDDKRVLYKLKHNPNWYNEPEKYVRRTNVKTDKPSYAFKLSDLEVINESAMDSLTPELNNGSPILGTINASLFDTLTAQVDPFNEESYDEIFKEKEDNHYTSMTVRDIYCMIQNVPMSNKTWLNQLISKNNKQK